MAFNHDVFLSYSSKDVDAVKDLAERLRARGLRVWFDLWEISLGDSIPAKIEAGLEGAGVLVLCMSANAFSADWTTLESQTFRFRDPLNRERRFVPIRLDGSEPPGSLGQFRYADWRDRSDAAIEQLVSVCHPTSAGGSSTSGDEAPQGAEAPAPRKVSLGPSSWVLDVAYSPDSSRVLAGSFDRTVRVWDVEAGWSTVLEGHTGPVSAVAYSPSGSHAVSGSYDTTIRIWDLATGASRVLEGHNQAVMAVAYSPDGEQVLTGSHDRTVRVWDLSSGVPLILGHHEGPVTSVAYSPDGTKVVTGSNDCSVCLWDLVSGSSTVVGRHYDTVTSVAYSPDGEWVLSGSNDKVACIWEVATGAVVVLGRHKAAVTAVAYSPNGSRALTGTHSGGLRVWRLVENTSLALDGHVGPVTGVAFSPDSRGAITSAHDDVRSWDLRERTSKILEGHTGQVSAMACSTDGRQAASASQDRTVRVWDLASGTSSVLSGHTDAVTTVAYGLDGKFVLTGSLDRTVRVWEIATGLSAVVGHHTAPLLVVACSADGAQAITSSSNAVLRLWDLVTGEPTILEGHAGSVIAAAFSPDGAHAVTGADDDTVRVWDLATGQSVVLEGHTDPVTSVVYSPDGTQVISGSEDRTVRVWNLATGMSNVLEGHTDAVEVVAYSPDGSHALSGSADTTVRVWDLSAGTSKVLEGHSAPVIAVDWSGRGIVTTVASNGVLLVWPTSDWKGADDRVLYTNAKVVLVGESQAGKSGLAIRLATGEWRHTDSTIGAWATQMLLPHQTEMDSDERREIWLWDFGGQADQQLIHQLYMYDAALAVLVFDGQRDDAVPRLWHWTHALNASAPKVPRLLVGARTDISPIRVSDADMATIRDTADYAAYLPTSARTGAGCQPLREAIVEGIDWSGIPWRSTPRVFQRLREAILELKDNGRTLVSVKDLRDLLPLDIGPFKPDQLDAVIGLLAGPGAVMTLGFGDWVLLRPELLNSYAQAVIFTLRSDPEERGCIEEERVLTGDLDYPPDFVRLPEGEESIVLLAMHKQLVERELCFHDRTDPDDPKSRTAQLIFPSYFRRDRPDRPDAPISLVTYRFQGMLETIYASLVTRLHRSDSFDSGKLWRDAADFTGPTGTLIGVRLTRLQDGEGQLDIYYDQLPAPHEQVLFDRHVGEHLRRTATDVRRLRVFRCPACNIAMDKEATQRRIAEGKSFIRCNACDEEPQILFFDELEQRFTDSDVLETVARERDAAQLRLDTESLVRQLVGEVYTVVATAGQIAREILVGEQGLDMEIEFKDDHGHPTGRSVWLQLESGDPLFRHRREGESRVIPIDPHRADRWADHPEPLHLVVRDDDGRLEAVDLRMALQRLRPTAAWPPVEVLAEAETFDVMCVRRWRQRALDLPQP